MCKTIRCKSEILINNNTFYSGSSNQEVEFVKNARCPDCDTEIEVPDDVMKGEIISCPSCGLELEVTEIKGDSVELKELGIEGEDWGE
jgi:alpha-aminoadipate carrier protein LysW